MVRHVVLHIGPHKTASTSFQFSLNANINELRAQGFCVYHPLNNGINAAEVAAAAKSHSESSSQVKSNLSAQIEQSQCHTLLLSAEPLWRIQSESEVSALKSLFDNVDVKITILFVNRRFQEWEASYRRMLGDKEFRAVAQADGFCIFSKQSFKDLLSFYEGHFDEVLVVDFESEKLIRDLYVALGVHPEQLRLKFHHNSRSLKKFPLSLLINMYSKYLARGPFGKLKRSIFNE
ncbi:hypothetical protein V6X63_09955 [Spiribacter sp. 221]|uniref:hypothetical protein n=1 Tax=Spiribacter onubensis TaxID=3122420 RepID=UPI00349FA094